MNEQNLIPFTTDQSREAAVRNGRAGGIASGKAKRQRKSIAEALRKVLDEPLAKGSRQTKLDGISMKAIKKIFDDPDIKDIKTLAEILGELKLNLVHEGRGLTIEVSKEIAEDLNADN